MQKTIVKIIAGVLFYGGLALLWWKYGWQLPIGIAAVFIGSIVNKSIN